MSDPKLPIGTNYCLCTGCGRYFGGVSGFDAHQSMGADGSPVCHDPATLANKKGELLGYVLNDRGYWIRPMPEDVLSHRGWGKFQEEGAANVETYSDDAA